MAESDSIWMYNPSFALAILGTVAYGIIFIITSYQTLIKYRAWYFVVVPIGATVELVAYIFRTYSVKNQSALTPFIITLSLTVLAPIFIAAGNYLLISRLIVSVLPPSNHRILKIPGRHLTPIFVVCDVIAFSVQGSGSAIASTDDWTGDGERIGRRVLIGGLVFQLIAFAVFLCLFRKFHVLGNQLEVEDAPKGWRTVVRAVYISSGLIMVRCIYRVCEFAEGMNGYAFRTEWLFWVFECVPMIGAIGIFCMYHPSRYLGKHGARRKALQSDETELSGGSATMT
ncbi:RTA1 like protein-domain-containing protein [Ilyonectria destructans]|nr:RTA1 like protein-domain-containing protein [Ilyonectria destructans]